MWYRILFVADGVTDDWIERDSVTVRDLQMLDRQCDLNKYYGGINLRYRVLRRNAQNGKWFLYHSNQHILKCDEHCR